MFQRNTSQNSRGNVFKRGNSTTTFIAIGLGVAAVGVIGYQMMNKGNESTSTSASGQSEIVRLSLWDQEEGTNTAVMDTWIARFHDENPNIRVQRQTYPPEDLRTKFVTAATGGQAAELVWGPNDYAGVFGTAQLIQSIDDFVDPSIFAPAALDAGRLGGQNLAVPVAYGNHLMLFYNKSMISAAPTTTDELIEIAKTHTNAAQRKYGFAFFQNEPFWLAPIMGGFGSWPLDVAQDGAVSINLGEEGTKKALTFIRDLKFTHKVTPTECDYDCAKGLFIDGMSPLTINGDWAMKEFREKLGDDLGVAPLPVVSETGNPMTPMTGGRYVFISSQMSPEKTEAVKKFVGFLTSKEVQVEMATKLERIPGTLEAQQDPAVQALPGIKSLIDSAQHGRAMPPQAEMRAAWDAMRPAQQRVMAGELMPDAAAELMQKAALENLKSLSK